MRQLSFMPANGDEDGDQLDLIEEVGDEPYMEARALGAGKFGVVNEDGELIGGPFDTLANAELWMERQ